MCSASQPSLWPCQEAMRKARHFLPSNALPPYPEPTDQMVLSSGKWQMKRRSGSQSRTACTPRLKSSLSPRCSLATFPMRAITRMLSTT